MCFFVIVGFPENAQAQARGLLRSPYHLTDTSNRSILGALPPQWLAGYLSEEGCGCRMYRHPEGYEPFETRAARVRKRYRKLKWSDAKIERAIEQMKDDEAKRPPDFRGLRIDVRRSIVELARSAGTARALVHFFSGSIEDEFIEAETASVSAAEFLEDDMVVECDVWYELA